MKTANMRLQRDAARRRAPEACRWARGSRKQMDMSHTELFPTSVDEMRPLDYEWDGYQTVTIWGSNQSIDLLVTLYRSSFADRAARFREEDQGYGDASFTAYLSDNDGKTIESICVVDGDENNALTALRGYIGSKAFDHIAKSGYKTVGVHFVHK